MICTSGLKLLACVCILFHACPAAAQLRVSHDSPETVAALIRNLDDPNGKGKQSDIRALTEIRPITISISRALGRALKDKSQEVRSEAAFAFTKIGPAAGAALPDLLEAITNKKEVQGIRITLSMVLGGVVLGPDDILTLLSVAQDQLDDEIVRARVMTAIGQKGASAKGIVPALLNIAKKDSSKVVQVAAWGAIAKIEPGNGEAPEMLLKFAKDETDRDLSNFAIMTLIESGRGERLVPFLIDRLTSMDPGQRWYATASLGLIGPPAKAAVPALVQALKDPGLKGNAIISLGKIGPAAKEAIFDLKEIAASDPDPRLRKLAAEAVEKILAGHKQ